MSHERMTAVDMAVVFQDLAELLGVPPEEVRGRVEELLWIKDHAALINGDKRPGLFKRWAELDGDRWWVMDREDSFPDILAAVAALREAEQKEQPNA